MRGGTQTGRMMPSPEAASGVSWGRAPMEALAVVVLTACFAAALLAIFSLTALRGPQPR